MTIRTKLLLTLATVVMLVVAHGLIDSHYARLSRTEIDQLGKVAVAGSSATHDMLDTLSRLESSLFADGKREGAPANGLPISDQGKVLFDKSFTNS